MGEITKYMGEVKNTLDKAVHGHDKAKKQIERIIGQWLNGTQDGYCFGFEGPPGVGKTSLAKRGLSDCLKDDNGESRPFAMIQMGGDMWVLHGDPLSRFLLIKNV
jgi:ATP-dependent Lon protease